MISVEALLIPNDIRDWLCLVLAESRFCFSMSSLNNPSGQALRGAACPDTRRSHLKGSPLDSVWAIKKHIIILYSLVAVFVGYGNTMRNAHRFISKLYSSK